MKEHPILFKGEMVRSILEGRKSQTRRVVKPQLDKPLSHLAGAWFTHYWMSGGMWNDAGKIAKCPYGQVGDYLWVRETFAQYPDGFVFKADFPDDGFGSGIVNLKTGETYPLVWKPSIHMPRKASRIELEITSVRIERVQEITPADAFAEGVRSTFLHQAPDWIDVDAFRDLWEKINFSRGYGWISNPWVWVVEFKVAA